MSHDTDLSDSHLSPARQSPVRQWPDRPDFNQFKRHTTTGWFWVAIPLLRASARNKVGWTIAMHARRGSAW